MSVYNVVGKKSSFKLVSGFIGRCSLLVAKKVFIALVQSVVFIILFVSCFWINRNLFPLYTVSVVEVALISALLVYLLSLLCAYLFVSKRVSKKTENYSVPVSSLVLNNDDNKPVEKENKRQVITKSMSLKVAKMISSNNMFMRHDDIHANPLAKFRNITAMLHSGRIVDEVVVMRCGNNIDSTIDMFLISEISTSVGFNPAGIYFCPKENHAGIWKETLEVHDYSSNIYQIIKQGLDEPSIWTISSLCSKFFSTYEEDSSGKWQIGLDGKVMSDELIAAILNKFSSELKRLSLPGEVDANSIYNGLYMIGAARKNTNLPDDYMYIAVNSKCNIQSEGLKHNMQRLVLEVMQ